MGRVYIKDKNIRIKGAIIVTVERLSGFDKENVYHGPCVGLAKAPAVIYTYDKYNFQEKHNASIPGAMPMIYCTYKK